MIGLAGTGDLVATALAPQSRDGRAGELLAQGVPAHEIPARIGQAVEALDMVPMLARALEPAMPATRLSSSSTSPRRRGPRAASGPRPGGRAS